MNAFPRIAGARTPGLLLGGIVAGALGFALAAGGSQSPTTRASNDPYGPGLSNPTAEPGMEGASSLPPNVTPGWKIRVCSEKTKADQINFKITNTGSKSPAGNASGGTGSPASTGVGGSGAATDASVNADLSDQTTSWSRGEASEIKLPSGVRDADKIRIEATPSQKDKKASVCVIYNDHVAKKMNFDDREVSTVKSTDNGECGC